MNAKCGYCGSVLEEDEFHPDNCAKCGAPIDHYSEMRMWVIGENNEARTISVREFLLACNSKESIYEQRS
jgi:uncharacterized membrane protein YvbJ